MDELRLSDDGVHGPGIYFYDNEIDAKSFAERGGGIIIAEVDTEDPDVTVTKARPVTMPGSNIILRYNRIIIIRDLSKIKILDKKWGV